MTSTFAHASRATRRLAASAALAATAIFGAACGDDDDPFSPNDDDVVGQYEATRFFLANSGDTLDLIAEGSFVTLGLNEDGTTTGQFFVPAGAEDGSDIDENLAGTWQLTGGNVFLASTADTFLRDFPLRVREAGVLEFREQDSAGTVLLIRFERQ
jgi:hypothetical protein